ncbi:hypothetical protein DFJ77DRAFT_516882 [Powellomyces hirtus]|nr:hypothetical protein DFJ77DRAFT_516882 [Powellomyces hirtus]
MTWNVLAPMYCTRENVPGPWGRSWGLRFFAPQLHAVGYAGVFRGKARAPAPLRPPSPTLSSSLDGRTPSPALVPSTDGCALFYNTVTLSQLDIDTFTFPELAARYLPATHDACCDRKQGARGDDASALEPGQREDKLLQTALLIEYLNSTTGAALLVGGECALGNGKRTKPRSQGGKAFAASAPAECLAGPSVSPAISTRCEANALCSFLETGTADVSGYWGWVDKAYGPVVDGWLDGIEALPTASVVSDHLPLGVWMAGNGTGSVGDNNALTERGTHHQKTPALSTTGCGQAGGSAAARARNQKHKQQQQQSRGREKKTLQGHFPVTRPHHWGAATVDKPVAEASSRKSGAGVTSTIAKKPRCRPRSSDCPPAPKALAEGDVIASLGTLARYPMARDLGCVGGAEHARGELLFFRWGPPSLERVACPQTTVARHARLKTHCDTHPNDRPRQHNNRDTNAEASMPHDYDFEVMPTVAPARAGLNPAHFTAADFPSEYDNSADAFAESATYNEAPYNHYRIDKHPSPGGGALSAPTTHPLRRASLVLDTDGIDAPSKPQQHPYARRLSLDSARFPSSAPSGSRHELFATAAEEQPGVTADGEDDDSGEDQDGDDEARYSSAFNPLTAVDYDRVGNVELEDYECGYDQVGPVVPPRTGGDSI